MEIEGSEPLTSSLNIYLEKDDKETIDKKDDKDVLIELPILIVTEIEKENLLTGYKSLGSGIVYTKVEDEITKLLIIDKVEDS